jgi:hypothetical protein
MQTSSVKFQEASGEKRAFVFAQIEELRKRKKIKESKKKRF